MNTNIILDGLNAMLKQLIAAAIADAVKPLEERIVTLQAAYTDWKGMEHVAAKAVQPLQDRVIALEINQTLVREGHNDLNEAVRNVLDDGDYVKKEDIYDAVTTAIDNYDFSDIIEENVTTAIDNYDFSDIVEGNMPDQLDKDVVQQMIDESLDNLSISRN
jgi:vacuolar-type H+-ATPase subunit E/Vma4